MAGHIQFRIRDGIAFRSSRDNRMIGTLDINATYETLASMTEYRSDGFVTNWDVYDGVSHPVGHIAMREQVTGDSSEGPFADVFGSPWEM